MDGMAAKKKLGHGGAREGAGRKPELAGEIRDAKVMARFTPGQLTRLQLRAESEGVTVAELVYLIVTAAL